jgi:RimJ/RimL family protein N-acetyltransferase
MARAPMKFSVIRPPELSDADALFPLIFQTAVTDTIAWDGPASLAEYRSAIRGRVEAVAVAPALFFTIVEPISGSAAGSCSLRPDEEMFRAGLGLWIGLPFQSKGLGTRVVRELLEYGFGRLHLFKIEAHVFPGNTASRRIFEKNGFLLEGTIRAASSKRGQIMDEWLFGKVRSDP